nr:Holliday junction resolvase RuvX [Candidatus Hoaglandella endobia]
MAAGSIIAFDFGTRQIGVAIGQLITFTARPLTACKVSDGVPNWRQIEFLLNEWQPETVVVGLPLNMDGSEQSLTLQVRKFANRLHGRFGVKVILHDERLSTVEARAGLFEHGGYRALAKVQVDAGSAVIILESWLQQVSSNFG